MTDRPVDDGPSTTGPIPSGRRAFLALMVAGFAIGSIPVFLGLINHDVAWCLYVGGRVLDGDRLYRDIYEINPPLITVLNFLPQLLSRGSGLSEITSLRLVMLGLVAASLLMTGRALLVALPDRIGARRTLLATALFALLPLVGYDFAQREHIMLACFVPYLTMAAGRAGGLRFGGALPYLVGFVGAVGLALKPHFVVPWMVVEIGLAWSRRDEWAWTRPECLTLAGTGLAYVLAVVVFIPEYFGVFAWASSVYASTNKLSWPALIREPAVLVSVAAWLGCAILRGVGDAREVRRVLLAANFGFLAIAILQNKGYSYHLYPPVASAVLLVGLLSVEQAGHSSPTRRLAVLAMRGVLAMAVLTTGLSGLAESIAWRGAPGRSDSAIGRMIRVVRENAGGGSIFTFSPSAAVSFPLVTYGGCGWASGHSCLWFLPALYNREVEAGRPIAFHPISSMNRVERFFLDTLVDDLVRRKPSLLIVDESENKRVFQGQKFDYLEYYKQNARFARFFRDYEPLTKVDEFRVYHRVGGG